MARLFNEILGKDVEVPSRPVRIISFSPALTETLFILGLGDSVVGVSAFCARPPEALGKKKVGSYSTVRYDLLDELKPDLILTVTGYQRDFAVELSKKYPAYPLELPLSLPGIVDQVVKLGLVVGKPEKARELAALLLRQLGGSRPQRRQRVYIEIDLGGPVSFGAYSYITDAITFLGSSTLYDEVRSEWLTPDLERVASLNPDVIFYEAKMFSKFTRKDLDMVIGKRGWGDLNAVREGKCYLTPGPLDFLAHHGPSFISIAVPWLADALNEPGNQT